MRSEPELYTLVQIKNQINTAIFILLHSQGCKKQVRLLQLFSIRWCTLRELRTHALFENMTAPSFHFSLNLVGSVGRQEQTRENKQRPVTIVYISPYKTV